MLTRFLRILSILVLTAAPAWPQGEPITIFAVVSKIPRDRVQVSARVLAGGQVVDGTLIAGNGILSNPIWRTIEICHSLKAEAWKTENGYQLASVRVLDPGMLPMELQGIAGDCLLRKALDLAPMAD
jgi:hypothetical protein